MKIGPQDPTVYTDTSGPGSSRSTKMAAGDARAALIRAGGVAGALNAAAEGSTVQISSLAAAARDSNSTIDVDMDKVQRVQAALSQGVYRVNPEAIADELIADAQALLKPRT